MDSLASIALCSEPPRPELMRLPPKRRDESILTPGMLRTIFTTGAFFVVVMLSLLLWLKERPEQAGLFFSIYVFFQVWNQVNCRSLRPETSGLKGLLQNPTFLGVAAFVALGQIAIVTFGGDLFKVQPLSVVAWLCVIGSTASVVGFAEIVRRIR